VEPAGVTIKVHHSVVANGDINPMLRSIIHKPTQESANG
jgi:hypothetical protein